jgi:Mn2+/Fe2+ NRAMP family transporter
MIFFKNKVDEIDEIQDGQIETLGTSAGAGAATAALDEAHVGDIHGALGTIRQHAAVPRKPWTRRLLALLAIMGPGLIVMVADNDAGGVATYAQAGQNYGTSMLWTLLLLVPVLVVNQEMVVRLGAVTGVGHARLIFERFGKFWGAFSVGDLFILNFLTIVTEFIGVSLALSYFGVAPYLSVPVAAVALVAMTVTGSFRRWERFMYVFIGANLLMIPLALMSHPHLGPILNDILVPGVKGGLDSTALLLIIAIVGTTVAPWQLFFQQSNVVDKRITPRWINFERLDTYFGSVITSVGAGAIIVAVAFAFGGTKLFGQFTDAGGVATGLAHTVGPATGAIFAIVLLNAAMIGAAAVTLSTAYAFGDVFMVKHSLHRKATDARMFYGIFSGLVIFAAAIVLLPHTPLGLITVAVQALAGVLLPSATVFLLLLCNDREVLGPWVNQRWLNALAALIVGVLVALSFILAATTLFPSLNATVLAEGCFSVLAVGLVVVAVIARRGGQAEARQWSKSDRRNWRMPPLAELARPTWSRTRQVGMYTLRVYLVVAAGLMVFKIAQLAVVR